MVVPCAVGREDEVAATRDAALALDGRVAAVVGQNGAACVGRMQMRAGEIAGVIDRHGAADARRDLQAPAEAGIGQQELLSIGEFRRRHVGLRRDTRDLVEIWRDFRPLPVMRHGLHLARGDATLGELARLRETGFLEPRLLRGRIRLRAQPDRLMLRVGVQSLHARARVRGQGRVGRCLDVVAHGHRAARLPAAAPRHRLIWTGRPIPGIGKLAELLTGWRRSQSSSMSRRRAPKRGNA